MYWIAKMSQHLTVSSMVMIVIVLMMNDHVEGAMRSLYFGPPPPSDPSNTDPYHWMKQAADQIRKNCPRKSQTPPAPPGDPCIPNPCQYGGTCHPMNGTNTNYTCQCRTDYSGQHCDVYGPCNPNPCDLGASCHPNNGTGTYYCKYYGTCQAIIDAGAATFTGIQSAYIKPVCDPSTDPIQVNCRLGSGGGGWMRLYQKACAIHLSSAWSRERIACQEKDIVGFTLSDDWIQGLKTWALHDGVCGSLTIKLDFLVDLANCQRPGYPNWSWAVKELLVEGVCSTNVSWGEISPDVCGSAVNVPVNISVDFSHNNYGIYMLYCLNAVSGEWIRLSQWAPTKRHVWVKVDTTGPCVSSPCQLGHTCHPVLNGTTETYICQYHGPCNPNPCKLGGKCHPGNGTTYSCEYYGSCHAIIVAGISVGDKNYYINPGCDSAPDPTDVTCFQSSDGGGWMRLYSTFPDKCIPTKPDVIKAIVCQKTFVMGFSISHYQMYLGNTWHLSDTRCSSLSIPNPDFFTNISACRTPSDPDWPWGNRGVMVEGVCQIDTNKWDVSSGTCGDSVQVNVSLSVHFNLTIGSQGVHVMSCYNAISGNWIKLGEKINNKFMWMKI